MACLIAATLRRENKNNMITYTEKEIQPLKKELAEAKFQAYAFRLGEESARNSYQRVQNVNRILRLALVGLVGADGEELDTIEAVIRMTPAPDADKASMINAIHALRNNP